MNKILWSVDPQFMETVEHRAVLAKIISLDVFDTAVTRLVDSPADAFAEMERRLVITQGEVAEGFAVAREQAEQKARYQRSSSGKEDVTLELIYKELDDIYSKAFLNNAWTTELDVERSLLVAVPEILLLAKRLHASGKRIIFVSDMYLPPEFLYDVLFDSGYPADAVVFVSGDLEATKHTGSIWPLVKAQFRCEYNEILHLGDDGWSDGFCPALIGVETMVFERARSERRVGSNLTPALLPFSYLQRESTLRLQHWVPLNVEARWTELGRTLGGIVLTAFVKWLHKRTMQHDIDRLYFLARDGYLIYRAWKYSGLGKNIDARYLKVSRRPLNIAAGYVESSSRRFTPHLIQFVCGIDEGTTVRHLLRRIDFEGVNEHIENELIEAYGSLDQVLFLHPDKAMHYEKIMRRNTDILHDHFQGGHTATMEFLKQEGLLDDKRIAVVDTGWNGSMQRFMNVVLEDEGRTDKLRGFYCGLWNQSGINQHQAGLMESAFASAFALPSDAPEVALSVALIEELNGAPHGSTINYGYDEEYDEWVPNDPSNKSEQDQYDQKIRFFQIGALEVVTSLFQTGSYRTLNLKDVTIESAKAAMAQVFLSPNQNELELLGSLGHCMMFEHSKFNELVYPIPESEEEASRLSSKAEWRPGLFRSWHAQATTREQKELIQKLARQHLGGYMSERQLRQFWA